MEICIFRFLGWNWTCFLWFTQVVIIIFKKRGKTVILWWAERSRSICDWGKVSLPVFICTVFLIIFGNIIRTLNKQRSVSEVFWQHLICCFFFFCFFFTFKFMRKHLFSSSPCVFGLLTERLRISLFFFNLLVFLSPQSSSLSLLHIIQWLSVQCNFF